MFDYRWSNYPNWLGCWICGGQTVWEGQVWRTGYTRLFFMPHLWPTCTQIWTGSLNNLFEFSGSWRIPDRLWQWSWWLWQDRTAKTRPARFSYVILANKGSFRIGAKTRVNLCTLINLVIKWSSVKAHNFTPTSFC
jgi:hypothetical protein